MNIQFGIKKTTPTTFINDPSLKIIMKDGIFYMTSSLIKELRLDFSKRPEVSFISDNNGVYLINSTTATILKTEKSSVNKNGSFKYVRSYEALQNYFNVLDKEPEITCIPHSKYIVKLK